MWTLCSRRFKADVTFVKFTVPIPAVLPPVLSPLPLFSRGHHPHAALYCFYRLYFACTTHDNGAQRGYGDIIFFWHIYSSAFRMCSYTHLQDETKYDVSQVRLCGFKRGHRQRCLDALCCVHWNCREVDTESLFGIWRQFWMSFSVVFLHNSISGSERHLYTSMIIAFRSPTLPVAVIWDLQLLVNWLYHVFVAARLVLVPSPLPVQQSGLCCQSVCVEPAVEQRPVSTSPGNALDCSATARGSSSRNFLWQVLVPGRCRLSTARKHSCATIRGQLILRNLNKTCFVLS